ncbi:MAG TPA: glycosyltransferase [Gemmatimonadales bacterium]|nr:glycosyltransferase [Gemmatimonadales bacterium]
MLRGTEIVIPCYNEAARLDRATFDGFAPTAEAHDIRLLFVDDGSSDNTVEVLRETCAEFPGRYSWISLERNSGKAEAVRQGLLVACERAEYVGFWDADLATPLDAIPSFLAALARDPAIRWVFGARVALLGRRIHRRASRHYLGRVFATGVSLALGMPVYDTQCGAKLFRNDADLAEVISTPFSSRWIFDVEMIARLQTILAPEGVRAEDLIFELPLLKWTDVAGSKVRGRDFFRAARELAGIVRQKRRARVTRERQVATG